MNELQRIIKKHYGLSIEMAAGVKPNMERSCHFGWVGEKKYVIKLEQSGMGAFVNELMSWKSQFENGLIRFATYVKNLQGAYYVPLQDLVLTIQIMDEVQRISVNRDNLVHIGEVIAQFHKAIRTFPPHSIPQSNFYQDYMFGEVPKAQDPKRLLEIKQFYAGYTPDYSKLTSGVIHNDLNMGNILITPDKHYLVIDYEHIKLGPVASDLGVFLTQVWTGYEAGDYKVQLQLLLEGYKKHVPLTPYDVQSVILFSIRYLFSDENYYTYLLNKGQSAYWDRIRPVQQKQEILLKLYENEC